MIFQLIFILFLLMLIASVVLNKNLSRFLKVGLSLLFTLGILFLIEPAVPDRIARAIGVSYGSDLVFYFTTILVFYLGIIGYQKFRSMEKKLETLARRIALRDVKNGP